MFGVWGAPVPQPPSRSNLNPRVLCTCDPGRNFCKNRIFIYYSFPEGRNPAEVPENYENLLKYLPSVPLRARIDFMYPAWGHVRVLLYVKIWGPRNSLQGDIRGQKFFFPPSPKNSLVRVPQICYTLMTSRSPRYGENFETVWVIVPLNIFFRLVKHLVWKLNQTQPTTIYLDVSVSIREGKIPFLDVLIVRMGNSF